MALGIDMSETLSQYDPLNYMKRIEGTGLVAGVDEAGRGALAGPVVAAAVILDHSDQYAGLTDSKKLSPAARERFYTLILSNATSVGISASSAAWIDRYGIVPGTLRAMRMAVCSLSPQPDRILVDGTICPDELPAPCEAVIRGDALLPPISAASVVAKVVRDRIMRNLDPLYPVFGFAAHKGYGTRLHMQVINQVGPTVHHRYTFSPIRQHNLPFDG